jgi:uncharacterized phosphosugar-binding protein
MTPTAGSTPAPGSAGSRYLATLGTLISRLGTEEWPKIQAAARAVAEALDHQRSVHVFGTGHSHLLAEELYYRAGGLVRVEPILFDGVMLHHSTQRSTALERMPGLASALLADHPIRNGDVLIVASNSGGNVATIEMARLGRQAGATVIAVTSMRHATSAAARHSDLPRLHTLADIVLDNGGIPGDAAVDVPGFAKRIAPTSTVIGAAIVNAVVAEAVQLLVERGRPPEVYASLNTATGDAEHAASHPGIEPRTP